MCVGVIVDRRAFARCPDENELGVKCQCMRKVDLVMRFLMGDVAAETFALARAAWPVSELKDAGTKARL